ncbi:MAG TPA: RES family NAD+ phosphorylase [Desulfuromonadales bacterium]|nr:RES family NAD+ phosphorylase [Desulfuromonadales bacterium]
MFPELLTAITDFRGDLYRNIKTARESIDCYDDLGDGGLDTEIAVAAEMVGHPPSHAPMITRPFDYGVAIAYPFIPDNWQETRFSDGRLFGVWYGSTEMETTIFETVYHWRRFVEDSFAGEDTDISADRRVMLILCQGVLINLIGKEADYPALLDPMDYTFTQAIGRYLHDQGQNGLLVTSTRCDGINAAIFKERVLSNTRDFCYLTYFWNPARREPLRVEREPGTPWLDIP